MPDVHALVTRYLDVFNEAHADRRRELLSALYTADCTYTDAHVDLQGVDQIDGLSRKRRSASQGSHSRSAAQSTRTTTRPGSSGTPVPTTSPTRTSAST